MFHGTNLPSLRAIPGYAPVILCLPHPYLAEAQVHGGRLADVHDLAVGVHHVDEAVQRLWRPVTEALVRRRTILGQRNWYRLGARCCPSWTSIHIASETTNKKPTGVY